MSLTPITNNRLGLGGAVKQFGRHAGQIAYNAGQHMLENPATLKSNSLIISSLIVVLSRILVANLSAIKTKGTPEGPHRYREAISTNIREVCGWTFGFLVLRQFQNLISLAMRKGFDITIKNEPPKLWSQLYSASQKAFGKRERLDNFPVSKPSLWTELEVHPNTNNERTQWLLRKLKKIPWLKDCQDVGLMKSFYRATPIILGSIPAIALAGYMLERFTRDHGDEVVSFVSRKLGPKGGNHQNCTHGGVVDQRFDQFLSRVKTRRSTVPAASAPDETP